jgi:soluble lytic murein transglycosylase-like protein
MSLKKHMLLLTALAVALPAFAAGNRIVAVEEDGHTVYVDQPAPTPTPTPSDTVSAPHRILVYYSVQEHRWKRVPGQSPSVTKAHSAALDVARYVDSLPTTATPSTTDASTTPATTGRSSTITREELDKMIDDAAAKHGVDPALVRAVIKVESNYNPRAVSRKGAIGLMQLMPGTARKLRVNPYDPHQNVEGGVAHLASLLNEFDGDLERSLAAYNAGAGSVQRSNGIPPYRETRDYVRRITNMYSGNAPYRGGTGAPIRVLRQANGVLLFTNE